jgi:uroporphyrinogen-III synthase
MPEEYVAEAIASALGAVAGRRVLLLRADIARRSLAEELRAKGADVREVAAYRTVVRPPEPEALRRILEDRDAPMDVITCTSSSTVQGLVRGLEVAGLEPREALRGVALAAIGPVTARTLGEYGLEPAVVAADYTMAGLAQALIGHYRDRARAGAGEGA